MARNKQSSSAKRKTRRKRKSWAERAADARRTDRLHLLVPSEPEAVTISAYTESEHPFGHKAVNDALRGITNDLSRVAPVVEILDEAIARMPKFPGTVGRHLNLSPEVLARYEIGEIVTEPGYVISTNVVAPPFKERPHLLEIDQRSGTLIKEFSVTPGQHEVLLPRGLRFQVVIRVDFPDGRVGIVLLEV